MQSDHRCVMGINPVAELLRSGNPVDRLYVSQNRSSSQTARLAEKARTAGIPVLFVDTQKLDALTDNGVHQGIVALCAQKAYCSVSDILNYAAERKEKPFVVILDGIKDPHNFGAIIRSAEGAGAHGIIIPKRGAAPLSETTAKTSAGALEYMRIARVPNLVAAVEELKKSGLWIYGSSDHASVPYTQESYTGAVGLVIGDEGCGISRLLLEKCDYRIRIPMAGQVNSLNASVAAGVLLYEVVRQRGETNLNGGKIHG